MGDRDQTTVITQRSKRSHIVMHVGDATSCRPVAQRPYRRSAAHPFACAPREAALRRNTTSCRGCHYENGLSEDVDTCRIARDEVRSSCRLSETTLSSAQRSARSIACFSRSARAAWPWSISSSIKHCTSDLPPRCYLPSSRRARPRGHASHKKRTPLHNSI